MSKTKTAAQHASEDLRKAVERLRTEEGWIAWVKAKKAMYAYSVHNQLLIWSQRPDATLVRGRRQWADDFNRQLVTRAQPIWIRAPRSKKLDEIDPATGQNLIRRYFKNVRVYDVADTAQIPDMEVIPLAPPSEPIVGDSHDDWFVPLHQFALNGLTVRTNVIIRPVGGSAKGFYNREQARIVIDEDLSPNERVHVLIHELCHAMGIAYSDEGGRERAETCCEAAAHIACHMIGLDVSGESVPYIAGWHDEAEEIIGKDLERIHSIANAIAHCRDHVKPQRPAEAERAEA